MGTDKGKVKTEEGAITGDIDLESGRQYINQFSKLFNWCLEKTTACAKKGNVERALGWASITAECAWSGHPGFFSSPSLENILIDLGQSLPAVSFTPRLKREPNKDGRRILHVLSTTYRTGGHTRLVKRWIENAFPDEIHSIVITNQEYGSIPDWLEHAVRATGGNCFVLDTKAALSTRASLLREIARSWADMVVLHIHPNDPIPVVAFAVDDLPPVVFSNHADHVFWLGASVADIVADIRPAGQSLSLRRRNVRESTILPIPLPEPKRQWNRSMARKELGLPAEVPVLLSVGSTYKYKPMGGYCFTDYALQLVDQVPDAVLLVIGPDNKGMWKEANKASNGRIRALGVKENLQLYNAAADIYLEGFPISSLTAMLEAALSGANVINSPVVLSSVLSSDDVSLNHFRVNFKGSMKYTETIKDFILDKAKSEERSKEVRERVISDHCAEGWRSYLAELENRCPSKHMVQRLPRVQESVTQEDLVWALFQGAILRNKPLYSAVSEFGHRIGFADKIRSLFKVVDRDGLLLGGKCVLRFIKRCTQRTWHGFNYKTMGVNKRGQAGDG